MNNTKTTPIVVFFFNRSHVLQVLDVIRKYKPKKLYLVADGGRTPKEHQKCLKIRKSVAAMLDWKCSVIKQYKSNNLGVDIIIPEILTDIFRKEEKLIILEDDCVPDLSFFSFCEDLLEKYKNNKKVTNIAGTNWFDDFQFTNNSYFFSIHPECSGWATWKRAWNLYDHKMNTFKSEKSYKIIKQRIKSSYKADLYYKLFEYHYLATVKEDWQKSHWDGKWY